MKKKIVKWLKDFWTWFMTGEVEIGEVNDSFGGKVRGFKYKNKF